MMRVIIIVEEVNDREIAVGVNACEGNGTDLEHRWAHAINHALAKGGLQALVGVMGLSPKASVMTDDASPASQAAVKSFIEGRRKKL